MRLSHIIAPGPMAGAENVVLQGCQALLGSGATLSLFVVVDARCPSHGEQFAEAARARKIPVQTVQVRGRVDLRALMQLRRAWRTPRPDVIHSHGYKALVYSMLARPAGTALVVTHHGDTGHDRLVRFYEGLARALYARVDLVFSVSHATTDLLAEAGVRRAKLRMVPNPVSLPPPARSDQGSGAPGALLFVGRLSREKGLHVLLRALASDGIPEGLRLEVAGDGPCAGEWKALCTSLGLDDRVRWLGMRSDIPNLLAESEAMVLPSLREGLPLAVLEATSCEVPVIASRVGGVPEAVWEGENAILVEPGDIEAWARALRSLPEQLEMLREGARRRGSEVRARHAPERWALLMMEHYRDATKQ